MIYQSMLSNKLRLNITHPFLHNIQCNFDYQFKTFRFLLKGTEDNTRGNTVAHNYMHKLSS